MSLSSQDTSVNGGIIRCQFLCGERFWNEAASKDSKTNRAYNTDAMRIWFQTSLEIKKVSCLQTFSMINGLNGFQIVKSVGFRKYHASSNFVEWRYGITNKVVCRYQKEIAATTKTIITCNPKIRYWHNRDSESQSCFKKMLGNSHQY